MPVIPGFVHHPGVHCGSTALRNLIGYSGGPDLSEAMCFGLGAGPGFAYLEDPALLPSRSFCGRAPHLERHFFLHLGLPFSWRGSPLSWEEIRRWVDGGVPVLVLTDLYHLDYYGSPVHFGGHAVVVAGYGPGPSPGTSGAVLLADTHWPGLQGLPYERFRQSMHSPTPPFPVNGHWTPVPPFTVDRGRLPDALRAALAACARSYLHAPPPPELAPLRVRHYGLSGLRAMASSLPGWADAPDLAWCCRYAYQMIERRGTGGGAFRLLYAAFLRQARALLPDLPVAAVSAMERASALWTRAAALFRYLAGGGTRHAGSPSLPAPPAVTATLRRIGDLLLEAASHEEEAFTALARL